VSYKETGRARQRGYILISILFAMTIAIIALAAAVPAIKTQIKRQREEELINRANQYKRAIQLYYRRYKRYPASLDQLENTNNIRFLRQKYKDPISGKDEWKLLHFGEVVAKPTPAYLKGATPAGALGGRAGGSPLGGTGTSGATGPGVANASDMSKPLSTGQTLGGGPIVGVSSLSEKEGLKEIDGKTKYNEWQFVYDPTLDRSGSVGGQPAAGGIPGAAPAAPVNPGTGINLDRPTRPTR
jgi:type II secretory pathway pseudopilin PulG